MSQFTVSPVTVDDLPAVATVSRAAFRDSQHNMPYYMFPRDNEKAIYDWRLRGVTNIFHNFPGWDYTKCVENSTNKIVAFSLWMSPAAKAEGKKEAGDGAPVRPFNNELPEGTNVQLMNAYDEIMDGLRENYVDDGKDYILQALATLPEYQGRGCGRMLLKAGLEKVDSECCKAWLEATPHGRHLYTKLGWKVIEESDLDLSKYGCGGIMFRTTVMLRDAVST